ncbi:MAG: lipopolysaccharide heptosyltransferase II [Gammaproteobacteria bacterium]|nr:lipopolysaccharide heptosyltransferase II [Gammaproteobacteria bacterium]
MADQDSRILVIAQAWVGDVVLSQILYALLKRQQPDVSIDVVAPSWAGALLGRMPQVSRHIPLDIRHGQLGLWRRWTTARRLHAQYQQAIIIPRSAKAALVPWAAGIKQRIGFDAGIRNVLINDSRSRPPGILARMARLASPGPIDSNPIPHPNLEVDPRQTASVFRQWEMAPDETVIGLMPGAAYGRAKQWGEASFVRLAALLAERGHRICVIGTAEDRSLGDSIVQAAPEQAVNLCGETTLDQAVHLISGLAAAVCNDSGLMHVAAAVNTPVVGIYGPTSPDTHPPLADARKICSAQTLCSPCHQRTCPYGHHACMTHITPEQVCEATFSLLNDRAALLQ